MDSSSERILAMGAIWLPQESWFFLRKFDSPLRQNVPIKTLTPFPNASIYTAIGTLLGGCVNARSDFQL